MAARTFKQRWDKLRKLNLIAVTMDPTHRVWKHSHSCNSPTWEELIRQERARVALIKAAYDNPCLHRENSQIIHLKEILRPFCWEARRSLLLFCYLFNKKLSCNGNSVAASTRFRRKLQPDVADQMNLINRSSANVTTSIFKWKFGQFVFLEHTHVNTMSSRENISNNLREATAAAYQSEKV